MKKLLLMIVGAFVLSTSLWAKDEVPLGAVADVENGMICKSNDF